MLLRERIDIDHKNATYSRDQLLLDTIRAIKNQFVIEIKTGKTKGELSDAKAYKIIRGMIKQRKESEKIYIENNRYDLAKVERKQIEIIEKYLPTELTDSELKTKIVNAICKNKIFDKSKMGLLIKTMNQELEGMVEGQRLADAVSKILSQIKA